MADGSPDVGELTFIIGGARSGKSELALRLAAASGRPVTYLATAEAGDDEMARRIAAHRAERPTAWRTLEEPLRVVDALQAANLAGDDYVVLDCLTLWISNMLLRNESEGAVLGEVQRLLDWRAELGCDLCLVSNEVGMGVVPDSPLGRAYRDLLGRANRLCAAGADRPLLAAAGFVIDLKVSGGRPISEYGSLP